MLGFGVGLMTDQRRTHACGNCAIVCWKCFSAKLLMTCHRTLCVMYRGTYDNGINFLNNNTTAAPSNRLREKPAIDCAAADVGHCINEPGPYCQAHDVATLLKGCHHVLGSMDGRPVVRTAWRCRQNHYLLNFSGEASFATSSKRHFSNYFLCKLCSMLNTHR